MVKRISSAFWAIIFLMVLCPVFAEDEALLQSIHTFAQKEIMPLVQNPIVINAIKQANTQAIKPLDEILRLDKKWRATEGIDDWIGGFLNNACADYLRGIQKETALGERSLYNEIFVMDKQGSIVSETDKTSDYWQGDEDKFIKSFSEGKGVIFLDEPAFDESTENYLIHVCVPVFDSQENKTIGVVAFGMDIDVFAQEYIFTLKY